MAVTTERLYEQTLVIRSQLGDEAAFAELVERHGPRLLWFTRQMMQSSPDSVADVMQDIWLAKQINAHLAQISRQLRER